MIPESSAAAARPPRARAADRAEDVGYVRALQASEHRMMTSIEEVNLRLHDARTNRRDIRLKIDVVRGQRTAYKTELHEVCQAYLSFKARNRALLARLETLETHMSRMEWWRQRAEDDAVRQMIRTHVLQVRTQIDTVEDTGSSCAALTWWNGHVRTLGHDAAYAMTWGTLKKKLTEKYCPKGEIKKLEIEMWNLRVRGLPDNIYGNVMSTRPKTLDEAIELANDLMDKKIRTYAERQNDNKRKADDSSRNNQQPHKKQNVVRAYTAGPGACYECGNTGHIKKNCPKLKNRGNSNRNGTTQGRAYALGGRDASPDSNVIT
ncbi:putative reverse transcriptase domain-containing protein, partial [Tanacetum coccineum]